MRGCWKLLAIPGATAPGEPKRPGAESQALRRYYAAVEADLLAQGLMRTDGGGPDTRFGPDDLLRNFERIAFIDQIRSTPDSRRIIVSAWNVAEIENMALPPCHCLFQFYVADGKLSCQLYQRSCDIFLGVPFKIASYALLTHMVAQQTELGVGEFIWTGGDCHLYLNHLEQADEQLSRQPLPLPRLAIRRRPASIFDYEFDDFEILNYESHPHIAAAVAV